MVNEITVIVHFALHSITDIFLHNKSHSSFNKSVAWIKYGVPPGQKVIAWLSIKYNKRNRNVYLGKEWAQMYTMKSRANELTFLKNERKCAATGKISSYDYQITGILPFRGIFMTSCRDMIIHTV